jgi:catechol 2,3-dioxygenase-like lactoylglutathione lyase family enzyme
VPEQALEAAVLMDDAAPPASLGLRHVALWVADGRFDATVRFYRDCMGLAVVWQPDADNVYMGTRARAASSAGESGGESVDESRDEAARSAAAARGGEASPERTGLGSADARPSEVAAPGMDTPVLDNLAIHRRGEIVDLEHGALDHLGFCMPDADAVLAWERRILASGEPLGARITQPFKRHRDGSCSFYFLDPAGHRVQIIHVPNIRR